MKTIKTHENLIEFFYAKNPDIKNNPIIPVGNDVTASGFAIIGGLTKESKLLELTNF